MKKFITHTILLSLLLGLSSISFSSSEIIFKKEIELDSAFKRLRNSKEDTDFRKYNKEFKDKLKIVLGLEISFTYPFDSLKSMSKITSPDGAFRLFNWNVELESGINKFYCFILKKDGTIIELKDNHRLIVNPELKTLNHNNWYGALYYKIIPLKRGRYTLLGWNGKDNITTQKVIETMSLSRRAAKFGFALFEYPDDKIKRKRIILEYSNEAYVSVKYYESKKESQIVFSHLSPSIKQLEGQYQYYYPDLSYDRFVLKNGKWLFESDYEIDNQYTKPIDPKNYPKPPE